MELLIFILYFILSFLICSVVHELGHILMGMGEGFKFYLLVAGPFGIKRNDMDEIEFYIEKDVSLWGGLGATAPVEESDDNIKKFSRILLAGPIASILLAAVCLPVGIRMDSTFISLIGFVALGMGVACLIPVRNGAFYTDGGRWLRINNNEKTKAVEIAIWNITQRATIEGYFGNIECSDIEVLINNEDVIMRYVGHYFAYHYHKDNYHILEMEEEKNELAKLKNQVSYQTIKMYPVD
ncbi:MAG: site-2 protease family protein [Peptostreptococcaceae bacterium]